MTPKYTIVRFRFRDDDCTIAEQIYTTKYWRKAAHIAIRKWERNVKATIFCIEEICTAKTLEEAQEILDNLSS